MLATTLYVGLFMPYTPIRVIFLLAYQVMKKPVQNFILPLVF